jgi:DNA-binding response OmpR family regulator
MNMKRAGVSVEFGDRAVSDARDNNARHRGDSWPDQVIEVGNLRLHVGRLQADAGGGPVPLTRLVFLFLRELISMRTSRFPRADCCPRYGDMRLTPAPTSWECACAG